MGIDPAQVAYHKVGVVFWQTDEHDQPAVVTEPYEKTFTAANVKKEQEFYESDLTFRVRVKTQGKEQTVEFAVRPKDNAAKTFKGALSDAEEIISVDASCNAGVITESIKLDNTNLFTLFFLRGRRVPSASQSAS